MQSDAAGKKEKREVIIDVTDYGADPTGAADSAVAIREAIAAAKEQTEEDAKNKGRNLFLIFIFSSFLSINYVVFFIILFRFS